MHQVKNIIIQINEVKNVKKVKSGLEITFSTDNKIIAKDASFLDFVNAVNIEELKNKANRTYKECGFKISY